MKFKILLLAAFLYLGLITISCTEDEDITTPSCAIEKTGEPVELNALNPDSGGAIDDPVDPYDENN